MKSRIDAWMWGHSTLTHAEIRTFTRSNSWSLDKILLLKIFSLRQSQIDQEIAPNDILRILLQWEEGSNLIPQHIPFQKIKSYRNFSNNICQQNVSTLGGNNPYKTISEYIQLK